MDTEIVSIYSEMIDCKMSIITTQVLMRKTPLKEWFNNQQLSDRLSGTLKKNSKIGFKYMDQLRHEAIAITVGYIWEIGYSSRITFNDPISEGDCKVITEAGWFADRWLSQNVYPGEYYELKYIIYEEPGTNKRREGVGLICRKTTIQWILPGQLLFCIIAEFDNVTKTWYDAQNPF